MRIIVDTNIAFSGILSSDGKIGELLIKSKDYFEFFSVDQLKKELEEHKEKIIKISCYSEEEYNEAKELAISKIKFIRDVLIPKSDLLKAEKLLSDIDIDDTVFLALTMHLKAKLWTGDLKLIEGLAQKGFYDTITTNELFKTYLASTSF
jgi:predicted nucleic acid-binding protein